MREGPRSIRLGLKGIPAESESICAGRDVELAGLTRARLHIAHMSTTGALEHVRLAKRIGLRVTCEVTPHHFTLIDEDVRYDTNYKMNPPLASRADGDALIAGLADGNMDAIATDHAPHHPASKDVEFDRAPFGITGFETALALGLSELVHTGKISLTRLVELFTTGPARVLGIERELAADQPADVTIFSADHPWTYRTAETPSKSRNTPFDGRTFQGRPHRDHSQQAKPNLSPRTNRQSVLVREIPRQGSVGALLRRCLCSGGLDPPWFVRRHANSAP